MINEATLIVGAAVLGIIFLAAYFSYRSLKQGKCSGCRGCPNRKK